MASDARRTVIDALSGQGKDWNLSRLHREAEAFGLDCTRVSLHRKLYGYRKSKRGRRVFQPLTTADYRALMMAMGALSKDEAARLDAITDFGLAAA